MTRHLKPCGSLGGYSRHKKRGEPVCDPCREANRIYQADYRANRARSAADRAANPRVLAPCGTYGAARRHKAHDEELCDPCKQAERDYKTEKQRDYRAAKKAKAKAFEAMLADAWAEVSAA